MTTNAERTSERSSCDDDDLINLSIFESLWMKRTGRSAARSGPILAQHKNHTAPFSSCLWPSQTIGSNDDVAGPLCEGATKWQVPRFRIPCAHRRKRSYFKTAALVRIPLLASSAARRSFVRRATCVRAAAVLVCAAGTERAMATSAVISAGALGYPFQTQVWSCFEEFLFPPQFDSLPHYRLCFQALARARHCPLTCTPPLTSLRSQNRTRSSSPSTTMTDILPATRIIWTLHAVATAPTSTFPSHIVCITATVFLASHSIRTAASRRSRSSLRAHATILIGTALFHAARPVEPLAALHPGLTPALSAHLPLPSQPGPGRPIRGRRPAGRPSVDDGRRRRRPRYASLSPLSLFPDAQWLTDADE